MTPPHFVNVRIWEPIQPEDSSARYDDPLELALEESRLGEICGGGYEASVEHGVEFVDIDLNLANLGEALELVRLVLEGAGAPAGSEFRFSRDGQDVVIPFGTYEGVAVHLDGVNLPDEVYQQYDLGELAGELTGSLLGTGEIRGAWSGPEETVLFLYGPSADSMFSMIQPVLYGHPLCENARIVIRFGNPGLKPRAVRIPGHGISGSDDGSLLS